LSVPVAASILFASARGDRLLARKGPERSARDQT
jgi:hypothetical protein